MFFLPAHRPRAVSRHFDLIRTTAPDVRQDGEEDRFSYSLLLSLTMFREPSNPVGLVILSCRSVTLLWAPFPLVDKLTRLKTARVSYAQTISIIISLGSN